MGSPFFRKSAGQRRSGTALIQQPISGLHICLTIYQFEHIDRDARAFVYAPYPFVFAGRLLQNSPPHSLHVDHHRIFDQKMGLPSFCLSISAYRSYLTTHIGGICTKHDKFSKIFKGWEDYRYVRIILKLIKVSFQHSGSVNFQIKFKILSIHLSSRTFAFTLAPPNSQVGYLDIPSFREIVSTDSPRKQARRHFPLAFRPRSSAAPSPLSSRQGAGVTSGQPSASLPRSGPSPQFLQTFSHCFLCLGHGSLP